MSFDPATLARRLAGLLPGFPAASCVVAVSGGADSAALLHALSALATQLPALHVRALHVDHGLQAAAVALREAATALAARCGVPIEVLRVDVDRDDREGLEAAARRARYAALTTALRDGDALLTAHHRDDQAETVLLRLFRGAGLRGLAAVPAGRMLDDARGLRLVRPLLDVPRADLVAYATANALPWVEDPMNIDARFDRGYVRHVLRPAIAARWPAADEALARAAAHAADAQAVLDAYADEDLRRLARGDALDVEGLRALAAARRTVVLRRWFAVRSVRSPPARRLALVERELLDAVGPNGPRLAWDGVELRRFDGQLHLVPTLDALPGTAALSPGSSAQLGALGRLSLRPTAGEGLAAARVGVPLAVRARSGGERLRLAADGPRRAVKDLLREARVPPWLRERLPMLWDGARLVAIAHPDGAWIAADAAAGPGEPAYAVEWTDVPAVLRRP
jgi:tRNA(Ile)-lysidine synthase